MILQVRTGKDGGASALAKLRTFSGCVSGFKDELRYHGHVRVILSVLKASIKATFA